MISESILTEENALKIANEIIDTFAAEANEKTLEVDFKLKNGLMEINYTDNKEMQEALFNIHGVRVPQPNTHFSFNTKTNTLLNQIKCEFCSYFEKNMLTDNDFVEMQNFIKRIINTLNSNEELMEKLKNTVRKCSGADSQFFPFNNTRVVLFEFGHKEDYGDMIKVLNYSRYNKQLQSFVGEKRAVAQDLLLRRREFGYNSPLPTTEIYAKIIAEQKSAKNKLYEDLFIEDVKIVREAKECHIDIFVDYSPTSKDEMLAKLQSTETTNEQKS